MNENTLKPCPNPLCAFGQGTFSGPAGAMTSQVKCSECSITMSLEDWQKFPRYEPLGPDDESRGHLFGSRREHHEGVLDEIRDLPGSVVKSVGVLNYGALSIAHGFILRFGDGRNLTIRVREGHGIVRVERDDG